MKRFAILMIFGVAGCGQVSGSPEHKIRVDVYYRADSQAKGSDVTPFNMSVGETGVRLFGGDKTYGRDIDKDTFIVTRADEGYGDTIGRKFKKRPAKLLNFAD